VSAHARGSCLCGAVAFEAAGDPLWVVHCHCRSCRRQTASAVATFAGFRREQVTFTQAERALFTSSPGVRRGFCARCGTPISYEADRFEGEIHLYVVSFDDPTRFVPQHHVNFDEHVSWLRVDEHLPAR